MINPSMLEIYNKSMLKKSIDSVRSHWNINIPKSFNDRTLNIRCIFKKDKKIILEIRLEWPEENTNPFSNLTYKGYSSTKKAKFSQIKKMANNRQKGGEIYGSKPYIDRNQIIFDLDCYLSECQDLAGFAIAVEMLTDLSIEMSEIMNEQIMNRRIVIKEDIIVNKNILLEKGDIIRVLNESSEVMNSLIVEEVISAIQEKISNFKPKDCEVRNFSIKSKNVYGDNPLILLNTETEIDYKLGFLDSKENYIGVADFKEIRTIANYTVIPDTSLVKRKSNISKISGSYSYKNEKGKEESIKFSKTFAI